MFIYQTRLVHVASRAANGNVTILSPSVDTARYPGIVYSIDEAMSYIPPGSRPASDQWGGYTLQYDLRYSTIVNPIGVRGDGTSHLIVLYDLWRTDEERTTIPPLLQNSHEFGVDSGLTKQNLQARILYEIEQFIIRASIAGYTGDHRDPQHVLLATELDPTGMYDKVRDMKDVVRTVNTAVTNPSTAPLYTMVSK